MPYEEKTKSAKPHGIILEARAKMTVTGVEEVESFDENEIVMLTVQGSLRVQGSDLHVDKLDLVSGELSITGLVTALDYAEVAPGGSLWTRLFR